MKKPIKRLVSLFLIFVFSLAPVSPSAFFHFNVSVAAEVISGANPTIWNEPREIKGFIRIESGSKLILKENADLTFTGEYGGILVFGELDIEGTESDKVVVGKSGEANFFIDVEPEAVVNIKDAKIIGGGYDVFLVGGVVKNAIASDAHVGALTVSGGKVVVEDTTFENNQYAILANRIPKDSLKVNYSKFIGNNVDVEDGSGSDFKLNYWDDLSDDDESCQNNRTVENCLPKSSGNFRISPWQKDENISHQRASSVLFLPGLKASRLYSDDESSCPFDGNNRKLAWEPNCNEDVEGLFLNENGESIDTSIHTKEGDVIDETPIGSNVYKSFIEKMEQMKNDDKTIADWKAFAYDWRLSLWDAFEKGSLAEQLRELAENSKTGKVTIVAHSNGGLLAKTLMMMLGEEETRNLIDKAIFVAVPQVGTPAAVAALLHGEKQNAFPVFDVETARGFGENMSGAYGLLPSSEYFSTVQTPVVTFEIDDDSDLLTHYADKINSGERLHEFLADDFRRVVATDSDVKSPAKLNDYLLEDSESFHMMLDSWKAPDGIEVVQIAGWGVPKTLSSTEYENRDKKVCSESVCEMGSDYLYPDFKFTIDGDGTVVTPSALWMEGEERYWVDLNKYIDDNKIITGFGLFGINHADILELPELSLFITDKITNNTKTLSEYKYLSTKVPSSSNKKRLEYSLYSPLTLELYDEEGRFTGINSNGEIKEEIPGTYFQQFGDVKYIFADEDLETRIEMRGYETGTFTFAVEEFQDDDSLREIVFKDMPTTPKTLVAFKVPSDLESASNLKIDKDGDGTVDINLEPKIGEIVTIIEPSDLTAPVTSSSPEGILGDNDWYTSDVKVSLSAIDEAGGTGVAKTEYSLDDGDTWAQYENPITLNQEGIFDVQYFSTDREGNTEESKKTTIKIDKTAPEAKLVFDSDSQKLDVVGIDNLLGNVSVFIKETITEIEVEEKNKNKKKGFWFFWQPKKENKQKVIVTATLSDEAGHKTQVVWEKKKDKKHLLDLAIFSISYDENFTEIADGKLQYKWVENWRRNKYLMFASHLRIESMSIETHYFPNKNETWLMEKPRELADDENDDDAKRRPAWKKMTGMIIPSIITEKGALKINY
jgi:pimeloyl-ACP methyl ester carboxylesterase